MLLRPLYLRPLLLRPLLLQLLSLPRPLLSGFSGGLGRQYDEVYLGDLDAAFPCWYQQKNFVQKAIAKTRSLSR